jgi:hypothetical protein
MRHGRGSSRTRKLVIGAAAAALLGGALAVGTGLSSAGESCAGLDQALQNNLNFIAGQRTNPDALSAARIANRQAVVDLIQQRRAVAGCTANVQAHGGGQAAAPAQPPAQRPPAAQPPAQRPPAARPPAQRPPAQPPAQRPPAQAQPPAQQGGGGQAAGNVVCAGSTVTTDGRPGDDTASSGTFPPGTRLRVTNLDNNLFKDVTVADVSGSCVLLHIGAFNAVHEAGKMLIRRAVIQKLG